MMSQEVERAKAARNITPIAAEDATFRVRGADPAAARPSVARRSSGVFATGKENGTALT
jgi:hypothetical protein